MATDKPSEDKRSERRDPTYSFESERDLVNFFSQSLPKKLVRNTIDSLREKFLDRKEADKVQSRLQFLKKCEIELVRLSRSEMGLKDTDQG